MARLQLAFFSPLPPAHSGIADYSAALLPHLAALADVTLFHEEPAGVDAALAARYAVRPLSDYPACHWQFDLPLYHMGNSSHHAALYDVLLRYPGVVVLHDFVLHHFVVSHTAGRGCYPAYLREMGFALGPEGVELARRGRQTWTFSYQHPLNERLLSRCLGVIVHSEYARRRIAGGLNGVPVSVIPALLPAAPADLQPRSVAGWPDDAVILASLGYATGQKGIDQVMAVMARLRSELPQLRFLVVGDWLAADIDLPAEINRLGLADVVACTGFVEDPVEFLEWVSAAHVVVNLRVPTMGETSAIALTALAMGKPLIVSDHGWYGELPDGVCLKVSPGNEDELEQAIRRLAGDPAKRRELGEQAAAYAASMPGPSSAAGAYLAFIGQVLDRLPHR